MAATARPVLARVAILIVVLVQLQAAFASFYTVSSYFVITITTSLDDPTCTSDCLAYTSTRTVTVKPTVTPTVSPISSTTETYHEEDLEVVSLYLPGGAVAASDIVTRPPLTPGGYTTYTTYAVPVTWTAPATCPTPFTVATLGTVNIPWEVTAYITAISTTTYIPTYTTSTDPSIVYLTVIVNPTAVPATQLDPSLDSNYRAYVSNCRNPTATGAAYYGPGYSDDSGRVVCSMLTGCVVVPGVKTWVIVVATVLPTMFVLGLVENYFWFRRMMNGRSTLRPGTICWCLVSLWCVMITQNVKARSKEDQVLLRQYWASLGARTRFGLWLRWGFRRKYPTEVLGSWDGSIPVPVPAV